MVRKPGQEYSVGERVLCKHSGFFYDAKIVDKGKDPKTDETTYCVHYQGWHKRHDEWFKHNDAADMFKEFSADAMAAAKREVKEAQQKIGAAKKKKIDLDGEDKPKSENGSRGSTPSEKAGGSVKAGSVASDKDQKEKTTKGGRGGVKRKADDHSGPVGSNTYVDAMKDPNVKNADLTIRLPQSLKQILVDDHDLVNRQFKLTKVPARHTVESIIKDYCDQAANLSDNSGGDTDIVIEYEHGVATTNTVKLMHSSLGIKDYFDILLGSQLLYKFERAQYSELEKTKGSGGGAEAPPPTKRRKTKEPAPDLVPAPPSASSSDNVLKPSKIYGLPHLLRLFSRLDGYFRLTDWSDRTIKTLMNTSHDFLVFLNKNLDKYYNMQRDYELASPEYQKTAFAS